MQLSASEGRQHAPHLSGAARYHSALGSARETLACLEVAVECDYVQQDPSLHEQLDRIVATLVKLVAK